MAKKTKNTPATAAASAVSENMTPTSAPVEATPATPAVAKTKKAKVVVPLTPAQEAAKAAMEAANEAARQDLIEQSKGKLSGAEEKVAAAEAVLAVAKAELKQLRAAVGIKGTFGGKKANTLVYVKDFPTKLVGTEQKQTGAPQARQILEIVKAAGDAGLSREKVVETMKTVIDTNMDRSRLLSFYTSRMVEAGVIKVS